MNIGVITESQSDEYRVALTPDAAKALIGKGFSVQVQSGAGQTASFAEISSMSFVAPSAMTIFVPGLKHPAPRKQPHAKQLFVTVAIVDSSNV